MGFPKQSQGPGILWQWFIEEVISEEESEKDIAGGIAKQRMLS